MTLDERLAAPLVAKPEMCSLNMGSMNFNISPRRRPGEGLEVRLGEAVSRRAPTISSSATRSATSPASSSGWARRTARASSSSATTSGISTIWPIASTEDRRAAAVRADHLRHPGRHRRRSAQPDVHAGDGGPAVRRRLCLVGAGGGAAPDGVHHHGRHHGRQRARRAGGQPVYRQGQLAKSNAEQVAKIRRILEELSLEIATPTEAREMLKLKGGDRVGF